MNVEFRGVTERPIESLVPYEKNAKKHPEEQIEQIVESIKLAGFVQPVVVDKDNVVVIGHGRLMAAKRLGMKTVPCVTVDDLTDDEIKALRIIDNKVNESEWDRALLSLELSEIELDMSKFGFEDDLLESEPAKEKSQKMFEEMQLKQFEHHDYIVFVFENQMDWLNVLSAFEVKRVNAGYGKTRKIGLGRVINGKRLLEKIGYQSGDFEQEPMGFNQDE